MRPVSTLYGSERAPVTPLAPGALTRKVDNNVTKYRSQIQWGGSNADWHGDAELTVVINNRNSVVPDSGRPATGTQVSWAGPAGNGSITFFDDGARFQGAAQFPNEGPVGYRGEAQ